MDFDFLQDNVRYALKNLNINNLTEIRLRQGQPVIIEYNGEYKYLYAGGATDNIHSSIRAEDVSATIYRAIDGSIYTFSEQIKEGFITLNAGMRIGIAGEYVTENGTVKTIKNVTSLNIRIPHNVRGCADTLYERLLKNGLANILLYSVPGYGKTTMLRDLVRTVNENYKINILVLDARNEISGGRNGYCLGQNVDVVLCCDKLTSAKSAIRALKPQLIVTDELYGDDDINAVKFIADCGIYVFASSHISNHEYLKAMPFDYYVQLTGINKSVVIYDKNFNSVCNNCVDDVCRNSSFSRKEEENGNIW